MKNKSNFDLLFESILNGNKFNFNKLQKKYISEDAFYYEMKANLILEEVTAPQYIVSEYSGNAYLLEDVLFMSEEQFLIAEGMFDSVKNMWHGAKEKFQKLTDFQQKIENKINEIIDKIKEGLKNIIKSSVDKIKEWAVGIMNSSIVKLIIEKLGINKKINKESIKACFKVKSNENKGSIKVDEEQLKSLINGTYEESLGEVKTVEESVNSSNKNIISEEIILKGEDKEAADSDDEDAIKKRIEIWTNRAAGKVIRKKTGQPWKKSICDKKIELLNAALDELDDDDSGEDDNGSNENNQQQNQNENGSKEESQEESPKEESQEEEKGGLFSGLKKKAGGLFAGALEKTGKFILDNGKKFWDFLKKHKIVKTLLAIIVAIVGIALTAGFIVGCCTGLAGIASGVAMLISAKMSFKATYKAGKAAMESGSGYGKFMISLIGSIIVSIPILGRAINGLGIISSMLGNIGSSKASSSGGSSEGNSKSNSSKNAEGGNKDAGTSGERHGKAMDPDTSNSSVTINGTKLPKSMGNINNQVENCNSMEDLVKLAKSKGVNPKYLQNTDPINADSIIDSIFRTDPNFHKVHSDDMSNLVDSLKEGLKSKL